MSDQMREKCAVAAVSLVESEANAAVFAYDQLFAMQHRGAEGSGIASLKHSGEMGLHRGNGLVCDVYQGDDLAQLAGSVAIGHNRYSTSGSKTDCLQPIKDRATGFAFAHNGNLPDTTQLESYLNKRNLLPQHANDSQMMAMAIAQEIRSGKDLPGAIENIYELFTGAYSCVAMHRDMIVAFRDPYGVRPLALGQIDNDYFVSSETCGLDTIDAYDTVRDIKPGEMVIIQDGIMEPKELANGTPKLDMFELIYFARHDSKMLGKSINEFRRDFGRQLAIEHPPSALDHENVVVVPVPDTSIPIAEGYARALNLENSQAIVKNRYIGRTFMQPTHDERHQQLRRKHNVVAEPIVGKDVIIIDDSIVRLNTMPRIVKVVQSLGARSVNVLIGSPPVRFPDFYGIDTPSQKELAAANITVEDMRKQIGCNYLGFLSLRGMVAATGHPSESFNLSCFTGEYPIDIGLRKHEINTPVSMQFAD